MCRFALVGGPARQDAPKAVDALKKLNVPYLVSLPLVFQTTEEWMQSELGVHPVQVALQVCCSLLQFHTPVSFSSLSNKALMIVTHFMSATLEAWMQSELGVHGVQVALQSCAGGIVFSTKIAVGS